MAKVENEILADLFEQLRFAPRRQKISQLTEAEKLLKDAGFAVTRRDVICVDVPHCPGGLASVLNILSQANINVEYLYAIANTLIVFNLDDIDKGKAVLKQHNIPLKTVNEVES